MTTKQQSTTQRREFLTAWVPPVVIGIALPAHAATTSTLLPRPINYRASILDQACDDATTPPTASFTLCNEEAGSIVIKQAFISKIGVAGSGSRVNMISPALPVELEAGGCVRFQVTGAAGTPYRCGDSLTLIGEHLDPEQIGFITFPV